MKIKGVINHGNCIWNRRRGTTFKDYYINYNYNFIIRLRYIYGSLQKKVKKECTYKTTAIVSEIKFSESEDGTTYLPVYSYTYNGFEYTAESPAYDSTIKVSRGDEVEVYIDPDDPTVFYCPSDQGSKTETISMFFFGSFFLLCTFTNSVAYRKQHRSNAFRN